MKKTKKQKELIKSLIWSKFWQYKFWEIIAFIMLVFVPYYIGFYTCRVSSVLRDLVIRDFGGLTFWGLWVVGFVVIVCIIFVVFIIWAWMKVNWDNAESNAEDEVLGENSWDYD